MIRIPERYTGEVMKLERTKNTIRNASFGMINKVLSILFLFLIRMVLIRTLSEEYLGLNSLFSSVLSVLNLAELGLGGAIVFSMYQPIAEDDQKTVNALLLFYRKVYYRIGGIVLTVGLLLVPFLPELIKEGIPEDLHLTFVYLVFLSNTVLSYFLQAHYIGLLYAYQREDLISRVNIMVMLLVHSLQIILLLTVRNYYLHIILLPVSTVITNLWVAHVAKKKFPECRPSGVLAREQMLVIREKVGGLFLNKISMSSRNAFDSIFLSMFLGLSMTARYNNYFYVVWAISCFTNVLTGAVTAGAANSVSLESVEKNYDDMKRMNFVYMWLAGWCSICLLCMIQPFMALWVGSRMMLPMEAVIMFCMYFYIMKMGDVKEVYVQAKGIWWEKRFQAIAEVAANLVLNYLLGKHFGIYGIIGATLLSLLFLNFGYGAHLIFKHYFKHRSVTEYFRRNMVYALATAVAAALTYAVCRYLPFGIGGIALRLAVCLVLPNLFFWLVYRKTVIFSQTKPWVCTKLRKLLH